MADKILNKIGIYTIYLRKTKDKVKYVADSGKIIFIKRFNKHVPNPYRDVKEFMDKDKAEEYARTKSKKKLKQKMKKIEKLPKSLYLVLLKEEKTGKTFVKVGITSKKFIFRRFAKEFGYEDYSLQSILRRIESPNAIKLESEVKIALTNKYNIEKFRPLQENFSGYSECYDYARLDDIIYIFDTIVNNGA